MGRIIARLLVQALRSESVRSAQVEVTTYLSRRATAFILRKLRTSSARFND